MSGITSLEQLAEMILDRDPVHRGERCVQPHHPHFSINEPQADRCVHVQGIQQRGKFGGFALRMFQRSVDALVLLIAHDSNPRHSRVSGGTHDVGQVANLQGAARRCHHEKERNSRHSFEWDSTPDQPQPGGRDHPIG
jgi:hypothetical protein